MGTSPANTLTQDLQTLFSVGAVGGLPDGQLLGRFAARREEAAFEALIQRHGPMVWGVCRRILRDHHDAEEAFQATFLVLARKAPSIAHRELVANWLYAVAYKSAMRARAMTSKRRARERQVTEIPEPEAGSEGTRDDLLPQLDRELSRLPDKFRVPIVLCELEGKTHREAAEQLGWPIGTVSGRLSRAKAILARRLSRPGMTLSVGSLAVLLARESASASMPTKLIDCTAQAASLLAAGQAVTTGLVSAKVSALKEGVLKTMVLNKLTNINIILAVAFTGIGIVGTGLTLILPRGSVAQESANQPKVEGQSERPRGTASNTRPRNKSPEDLMQGVWTVSRIEQVNHQPTDEEKELWRSGNYTMTIHGNTIKNNLDKSMMYFEINHVGNISYPYQEMDMAFADGPDKDQKAPAIKAIFLLNGDDLTICNGPYCETESPTERPKELSVEKRRPGTFPTLWVLKRKHAITNAAQKAKDMGERVNTLRTQLREAETELKRTQVEVRVSEDHPAK